VFAGRRSIYTAPRFRLKPAPHPHFFDELPHLLHGRIFGLAGVLSMVIGVIPIFDLECGYFLKNLVRLAHRVANTP